MANLGGNKCIVVKIYGHIQRYIWISQCLYSFLSVYYLLEMCVSKYENGFIEILLFLVNIAYKVLMTKQIRWMGVNMVQGFNEDAEGCQCYRRSRSKPKGKENKKNRCNVINVTKQANNKKKTGKSRKIGSIQEIAKILCLNWEEGSSGIYIPGEASIDVWINTQGKNRAGNGFIFIVLPFFVLF